MPSDGLFKSKLLSIRNRIIEGNFWAIKLTLFATALSLFLAFPSYENLRFDQGRWVYVEKQIEQPLFVLEHPPSGAVSNIAFRLTVPVIAKFLNLNLPAVFALQGFAGVLLFFLITRLGYALTNDRASVFYLLLSFSTIYAGSTAFVEMRGIFDSVALCLLAAAFVFRARICIFSAVLLACFTDERAFFAAGFVFLYWLNNEKFETSKAPPRFSFLISRYAVTLYAQCIYWALRVYLKHKYSFVGHDEGRVFSKESCFFDQINNFPMGIWTGLEGIWIWVGAASLKLLRKNKPLGVLNFLLIAGLIFVSLSVVDITRSMAYLLPAALVAVQILSWEKKEEMLRNLFFISMAVCIFWPAYYAGGKSTVWWQYPLPLQLLRWIFLN